jgi:hypothetical protein
MDETRVNWWMDDTSRWHQGYPPTGWRQSEDGRWHPPGGDDDPTEEMWQDPETGPAHRARGTGSPANAGWAGRPGWARLAVLASMAVLAVVVVIGAAALTDGGGGDDEDTATGDVTTTVAPSTSVATTPPQVSSSSGSGTPASDGSDPPAPPTTARATTTTNRPSTTAPATTSPPPTDPGVHLSAACAPEGATAITQDGVPVTCTTQKCHGAPFDNPRWRRTAC